MSSSHEVPIAALGPLSALSLAVLWRGQLRAIAVAKATFAFSPSGEMQLAPAAAVAEADVHYAKNPMRSVRVASDRAPPLAQAEVLFWGSAHAQGDPVTQRTVRLAISGDAGAVIDKRLDVVGDRAPGEAPKPFTTMPIVYERAVGGSGSKTNPIGVGSGADEDTLPNILRVELDRADETAGFGPIASGWSARRQLLAGLSRKAIAAPILNLPDDFNWEFFQAAPRDQRIAAIPSRAWIVLEGLHPKHAMMHMRLPAMRCLARVYGRGDVQLIELVPDVLFIDGEAEHATVTFKGGVPVARVEDLSAVAFDVGLELAGAPVSWPEGRVAHAARPRGAATKDSLSGTMIIDDGRRPGTRKPVGDTPRSPPAIPATLTELPSQPLPGRTLPFASPSAGGDARASAAAAGGEAPWKSPALTKAPPIASGLSATLAIEEGELAPEAEPAAPEPAAEEARAEPPKPKSADDVKWAPAPRQELAATPRAPKPVLANPGAQVGKKMYGGFGKS